MTNEQINKLQDKAEKNGIKNEYSKAVLSSIHDIFDEIVHCSNAKESKVELTFHEVNRVAEKTEVLLNLLSDLLAESSELNCEVTNQLMKLKSKEM